MKAFNLDYIKEQIEALSNEDIVNLWNEYARENNPDDEFFVFDDEFFDTYFTKPMDAVRACFFGKIECWNDRYLKFNGYGNLESYSEYEAAEDVSSIYFDEYVFKWLHDDGVLYDYIEEYEEPEDEEEEENED